MQARGVDKSRVDSACLPKVERVTLRRIASLLRPDVGYLWMILALLVSSALLNLVQPILLKRVIDQALAEVRGALAFKDVCFSYDGGAEALHGVDLDIPAGHCVALVGPSGSGKSTLAALVARLYDPTSGAITVDGRDLRQVQMKSLRGQISVVSQDTFLFHTTIRENLRYSRPEASEEQIVAAAKAAQLHEFISGLADGYDTVVGDRGYRLSGGERQRVAIARAILRDPKILILDEATSALDSQDEVLIQAALQPLLRGRTSLVIAHRLSTIRNADLIAVMEHGRIVEQGRHFELLSRRGLYAMLYQKQAGAPLRQRAIPWQAPRPAGEGIIAEAS
jgi:ATP-binding cassette, subfamily B, bacterial